MTAKNVALNDFFCILQHLFNPLCVKGNTFAPQILIPELLTKNVMRK